MFLPYPQDDSTKHQPLSTNKNWGPTEANYANVAALTADALMNTCPWDYWVPDVSNDASNGTGRFGRLQLRPAAGKAGLPVRVEDAPAGFIPSLIYSPCMLFTIIRIYETIYYPLVSSNMAGKSPN